jgi:hypothetical protein
MSDLSGFRLFSFKLSIFSEAGFWQKSQNRRRGPKSSKNRQNKAIFDRKSTKIDLQNRPRGHVFRQNPDLVGREEENREKSRKNDKF